MSLTFFLFIILLFFKVLSDDGRSAITRGIQEGRDGKGIIYVFGKCKRMLL